MYLLHVQVHLLPDKPWVLNSRVFTHMAGIKEKFHFFFE